jgi:hypothetical protein
VHWFKHYKTSPFSNHLQNKWNRFWLFSINILRVAGRLKDNVGRALAHRYHYAMLSITNTDRGESGIPAAEKASVDGA